MKKSIYLLLLLLIGCAPVTTVPLSLTVLPPTPTITPSATLPPSPTTTPEGFQTSEGGAVQVFEKGKWVDLKPSEGIWGPVDETSVVLVDDGEGNQEAFTQMKLDAGFSDTDGDDLVNVAKYNEKTKKWEVVDFTITRSPQEFGGIDSRVYWIKTPEEAREVGYVAAGVGLLGLKVEDGTVTALVFHNNRVVKVSIDEIGLMNFAQQKDPESIIPKKLEVKQILEIIRAIQKENPPRLIDVKFNFAWEFPSPGTDLSGCANRLGLTSSSEFIAWCEDQISKGDARNIPTKADVEQALLFSKAALRVNSEFSIENPNDLWDMIGALTPIDDAWLRLNILEHR